MEKESEQPLIALTQEQFNINSTFVVAQDLEKTLWVETVKLGDEIFYDNFYGGSRWRITKLDLAGEEDSATLEYIDGFVDEDGRGPTANPINKIKENEAVGEIAYLKHDQREKNKTK